ncbi:hypothetical protein JHK85_025152 [Glycine max]|nr:hypothetical protein JHK85_025152 [Glycine max]
MHDGHNPPPSTVGVLGLGNGKASILSQLHSLGLIRNVVGHYLSGRGGGFLFFGDRLIPQSGVTPQIRLTNQANAKPVQASGHTHFKFCSCLSFPLFGYNNYSLYDLTLCKWRHHSKGHDFGYVAVVGTTRGSEVGKCDNVGFLLWRSGKGHNVRVEQGTQSTGAEIFPSHQFDWRDHLHPLHAALKPSLHPNYYASGLLHQCMTMPLCLARLGPTRQFD